jgi:4-carboxymuconolactone decarboxylase
MRITETARNNHEELFPHRTSTLLVTDPELIEVFDNFAFDEVLASDNLETRTRLMVILASLIASQALTEYRVMLAGVDVGVTRSRSRRSCTGGACWAGKVFDFLTPPAVLTERGVPLPLPGQSTTTRDPQERAGGQSIVGDEVVEPVRLAPADQQQQRSANCFSDYLHPHRPRHPDRDSYPEHAGCAWRMRPEEEAMSPPISMSATTA